MMARLLYCTSARCLLGSQVPSLDGRRAACRVLGSAAMAAVETDVTGTSRRETRVEVVTLEPQRISTCRTCGQQSTCWLPLSYQDGSQYCFPDLGGMSFQSRSAL